MIELNIFVLFIQKYFHVSFFSFCPWRPSIGIEVSIIWPRPKWIEETVDRFSGCPWYWDHVGRVCFNFKRPISVVGVYCDISSFLLWCGMLLLLCVLVLRLLAVRRWISGMSRAHNVEVEWILLAGLFLGNYGNFRISQFLYSSVANGDSASIKFADFREEFGTERRAEG